MYTTFTMEAYNIPRTIWCNVCVAVKNDEQTKLRAQLTFRDVKISSV